DFLRGFTAQRIVAVFLQRPAQIVEDLAKGPLAGAIAEKAVIVLQLDIEAVDVDRRQTGSAMPPDADGRQCVLSHFSPAGCLCWGQPPGNPLVSWPWPGQPGFARLAPQPLDFGGFLGQ